MYALQIENVNKAYGRTRKPFFWCRWLDSLEQHVRWNPPPTGRVIYSVVFSLRLIVFTIWRSLRNILPERWTKGTKVNNVLHGIDLLISTGQFVALVGPSGCGKSTLFKAICGTHSQDSGQIYTNGKLVTGPCRDVGIVYQDYDLYDSMTARQNVAIGLNWDEWTPIKRLTHLWAYFKKRQEYLKRADELLEKVGLGEHKDKYPSALSGGQRQRVAICQALIMEPKILLLDEPFGALDESTREELQLMLLHLYQENIEAKQKGEPLPYTILIVTHELNEAFYVSDRVIGLSQYHAGNKTHYGYSNTMGATIVYDKAAPGFHPNDPKDFSRFSQQKEDVLEYVMDGDNLTPHKELVTYWQDREKLVKS